MGVPPKKTRTPAPAPGRRSATLPSQDLSRPQRRRAPSFGEEGIPTSVLDLEALPGEMSDMDAPEPAFVPAFIYVEKGPGSGQLIPLRQGVTVIGRASIADLRLQHPSISRRHAQLTRRGNRFLLRDLGSQNGSFVNGKRVVDQLELFPGDELAMGNAILKLRGAAQPAQVRGTPAPLRASEVAAAPIISPPAPQLSPLTRVAVLAGAVGFGLASVLLVAIFNLMRVPPEAQTAGADLAAQEEPAIVVFDEPSVAMENGERPEEGVANAARIEAVTAQAAVDREPPAPEPAPARKAPAAKVAEKRAAPSEKVERNEPARVAAPKPAPAPVVVAKAEPAPARSRDAEALTRYEAGDLTGAIALAGTSELGSRLKRFKATYDAANAAYGRRDGSTALRKFAAAAKLDEEISSGWSKYGLELNARLSQLYTLVGLQHLKGQNESAAEKAFKVALKHDPKNTRAVAELEKLAQAKPAAAQPSTVKAARRAAAIDAAFD